MAPDHTVLNQFKHSRQRCAAVHMSLHMMPCRAKPGKKVGERLKREDPKPKQEFNLHSA